ncbi:hypothetical protein LB503_009232 [Fusarium chuoi]|nr:hypothetical protein LB503_009232 [Fusarium chuoi]
MHNRTANDIENSISLDDSQSPRSIPDGLKEEDRPLNWSPSKKWSIVVSTSLATFVVSFGSSVYSAAIPHIQTRFNVTPDTALLGITLYVIGFALGPMAWGPASELYGKRRPLFLGYVIFCICQLPCALAQNMPLLLTFRFLSGLAGSSSLAILGGMYVDFLSRPAERGISTAIFSVATFCGPTVGPIIGNLATLKLGWRWTAWLTLIGGIIFGSVAFLLTPETSEVVILRQRSKGNTSVTPSRIHRPERSISIFVQSYLTKPVRMFVREPILIFFTIYMSLAYGIIYLTFTTYPLAFVTVRGWSRMDGSLPFIGITIGVVLACIGIALHSIYYIQQSRVHVPERRLPPMIAGSILLSAGIFWFGWTSSRSAHWLSQAAAGCIHSGGPPCTRCRDRGDECVFPPKGTSFIFRRSRLERHRDEVGAGAGSRADSEIIRAGNLATTDPFGFLTDEVKNSYLRCSYKWSFHHIPNLLIAIRERRLDPLLVWAMLAITVRFSQAAPPGYATQVEASNTFAAHARSLVLSLVDQPTVHRAQVLLMLTGHSWGAGEGRRAWVYLGMAVRMAQVLGLFEEPPPATTREDFIDAEERRRTAWTCFLMDSLLSGGKGRDRMLSGDKMRIQLPCESDSFNFGQIVMCERLDGSMPGGAMGAVHGSLGIVANSMRVADVWGAVAKWACTRHDNTVPPWQPQSEFQMLLSRLELWKDSLPERLRYELFLLRAHSVSNQGQAYCYMHCIYFMSVIFLYRSYLPEVEMQKARVGDKDWDQWSTWSSKELEKIAEQVCDMLQEIRAFGLYFLRGLVPWIGFTIYTAVGTMLYFYHFPNPGDTAHQVEKRREHIVEGLLFLKDMRQAWPMADTWREKIKAMQIFYSNIKTDGDLAVTPSERREMRNAIIDYGALQPDPVRQPDTESTDEQSATDGENDQTSSNVDFSFIAPADIDLFDTDFAFGSNMYATFADATQGFWESFPGSMDITGDMVMEN